MSRTIMAMSQCPVCKTDYTESAEHCLACHWHLKPYPLLIGLLPDFSQLEKVKLEWARKLWAVSKLQQEQIAQLQLQLKQVQQKELYLQSQLEQTRQEQANLQVYLDQVNQEQVLQSQLEQARQEQANQVHLDQEQVLQSQLEQARQEQANQVHLDQEQVLQSQLEQARQEQANQVHLDQEQVLQSQPEKTSFPPPVRPVNIRDFTFQVVTVNAQGQQTHSYTRQADCFSEDLGGAILEMVAIAPGTFWMGSPATEEGRDAHEEPQHQVSLRPFWMGKFPVTQTQWQAVAALPRINHFLDPDPCNFKDKEHPVEQVSWHEAVEFCARLNQHTGRGYRLPSEAEWEYACRAAKTTPFHLSDTSHLKYADELAILKAQATTPFHFGDTITPDVANYDGKFSYSSGPRGDYRQKTSPVRYFRVANAFGLYDMHGNVWEWCADFWHEDYQGAPSNGSIWELNGDDDYRVLRGGSWYCLPSLCRAAQRHWNHPDNRGSGIGFRVVCSSISSKR